MSEKFAKLYNINNYQVLVTKGYSKKSKKYYLALETKINNEQLKIIIDFDSKEEIDSEYNACTITEAIIFRETTRSYTSH